MGSEGHTKACHLLYMGILGNLGHRKPARKAHSTIPWANKRETPALASERWLGSKKPAQAHKRPLISNQSIDQSNVLRPAQRAKMVVSSTQSLHSHSRISLVPQSPPACSWQNHENHRCLADGLTSRAGTTMLRGQSLHSALSRSGCPLRGQSTLEWKQQSHLQVWKNREFLLEGRSWVISFHLLLLPIIHVDARGDLEQNTVGTEHNTPNWATVTWCLNANPSRIWN